MKISIFGLSKDSIADYVANTILFIVGNNVKNINLTQTDVMKFYYEIKLFLEEHDVFKIVDQESFLKFIKAVLDQTEILFEEQKKSDPEFVDKLLKKHAWLWNIYASVNSFFDANDISTLINSDFSKKIKEQLDNKMIKDPELLDYKVKRDVDKAVDKYNKLPENTSSDFVTDGVLTETPGDGMLGGEIRIHSPWMDN